jgi:transcriptional regulator with XRE-family HTH domain
MTTDNETRKPAPFDVEVGARVRLRRKMKGMSQEQLADAIGKTFQQVQKYERGANRISCSVLHGISQALGVRMSELLGENIAPEDRAGESAALRLSGLALQVARDFDRIPETAQRRAVVDLVNALAETSETE